MADDHADLPEPLRQAEREILRLYRQNPNAPVPIYEDLVKGQVFLKVPASAAMREVERARGTAPLPDAELDRLAKKTAQEIRRRGLDKPREKHDKGGGGFWSRINDAVGEAVGDFGATVVEAFTGAFTTDLGEDRDRGKVTDQALEALDFGDRVWRFAREYDQLTGQTQVDPETGEVVASTDTLAQRLLDPDFYSPRAWKAAWKRTRDGDTYFQGGEPPNDLAPFQRTIAKRMVAGQSPEDIANEYQLDQRIVQTIAAAPSVQKFAEELRDRQISPGRDIAEGFGMERDTLGFDLTSGALDFGFDLFLQPDIAVGKTIKAYKASTRTVEGAVRLYSTLDETRNHPRIAAFLDAAVREESPTRLIEQWSRKGTRVPVQLAEALTATSDPDVAWEILKRAMVGADPDTFIAKIPHTSLTAKIGDKLLHFDADTNAPARIASSLYHRAKTKWGELPGDEMNLLDKESVFAETRALLDLFPKAFSPQRRTEVLDSVVRSNSFDKTREVVLGVLNEAADNLNLPSYARKPVVSLYNSAWKARSYFLNTDTGDELSALVKETSGRMIEQAVPHLFGEAARKLPLFTARELRALRWGQGSLTKHFLSRTGDVNTLGHLWLTPHYAITGLWVPAQLFSRPFAWAIRAVGLDDFTRLIPQGKSPLSNPRRYWQAMKMKGEFADFGAAPTRPSFVRHPFKYVASLGDLDPDVPDAVLLGRSRLLTGPGRQSDKGHRFDVVPGPGEGVDKYALHAWRDMLVNLLDDPVAHRLLEGQSIDEVAHWLRTDKQGQFVFGVLDRTGSLEAQRARKGALQVGDDADDATIYAHSVLERLALTVHGNEPVETLVRNIARGDLSMAELKSNKFLDFLADQERPPGWVKRDSSYDQSSSAVNVLHRATDVMFRYLIDVPDTRLARIPYYSQTAKQARDTLRKIATDEGLLLDDDALRARFSDAWRDRYTEIAEQAKTKADEAMAAGNRDEALRWTNTRRRAEQTLERGPNNAELDRLASDEGFVTERILTDTAKTHAANEILFGSLFYDPSGRKQIEEALRTHLPFVSAWREFLQAWVGIMAANPENIGRAARGLAFAADQVTDPDGIFSPGVGGERSIAAGPVTEIVQKLTGSGVTFSTPLDSFNLFTQSGTLPFGPTVQMAAALIAEQKPEWEEVVRTVAGPFGVDYAPDTGSGRYLRWGIKQLVPAWAEQLWAETLNPNQFANQVKHAVTEIALERGLDPAGMSPEQMRDVVEEATKRARGINIVTAIARTSWPGSLTRQYAHAPAVERYRALQATMGEDEATKVLTQELGPAAAFLTEPFTTGGMPPTRKAFELVSKSKKMRGLSDKFGGLFWALVENQVQKGEPFDYETYRWQQSQGIKQAKPTGPQLSIHDRQYAPGWVESVQIGQAWRKLDEARKVGEAMLADGRINQAAFDRTMREAKRRIALDFPAWGMSMVSMTNRQWFDRQMREDMGALAKAMKDTDAGRGLGAYVEAWDQAVAKLGELGYESDSLQGTSPAKTRVRNALHRAAEKIAKDHPDFRPFFVRHIRFALLGDDAEVESPVLELVEAS